MGLKTSAVGWLKTVVAQWQKIGLKKAKGKARSAAKKRQPAVALGLTKKRQPRAKKRTAKAHPVPV